MKAKIVLISTIVLILLLSLWQLIYLTKTKDKLNLYATNLKNLLEKENYADAKLELKKLKSCWNNVKKMWDVFSEHNDVEEILSGLESLGIYIQETEKTQALNECALFIQKLEHIVFSEKLSIANVF